VAQSTLAHPAKPADVKAEDCDTVFFMGRVRCGIESRISIALIERFYNSAESNPLGELLKVLRVHANGQPHYRTTAQ
jgi:hypothetical protein